MEEVERIRGQCGVKYALDSLAGSARSPPLSFSTSCRLRSSASCEKPRCCNYQAQKQILSLSALGLTPSVFIDQRPPSGSSRCVTQFHRPRLNCPPNLRFCRILGCLKIVPSLKIHPEAGSHSEISCQAQRHNRCDRTFPVHDLIHCPRINAKITGKCVLAQFQRLHKFFQKDFTWMDWR